MTQTLMSLTISALDEFERIHKLQEILEICLEQFDNRSDKTLDRADLLISLYISAMELHLDELRGSLEELRQQIQNSSSK